MTSLPLSPEQKLEWKQQLKAACISLLERRIETIEAAISEARESANGEDKSSAGDKYETSRAMGHLSQEMHGNQLEEAKRDLVTVNSLNAETLFDKVGNGTVVVCEAFVFFIALGLGSVVVNGRKTTLLSPQAPIAVLLHHKKATESFVFNGKAMLILDVF
ncbi:MAG: hypothetical protein JWO06_2513 [Bacteroidota bacterium]|nr:hypothetical protein [Bacteroidota bacterium]